jgi:hypothetical protein
MAIKLYTRGYSPTQASQYWKEARKYLTLSKLARSIILDLEQSKKTIRIYVARSVANGFHPYESDKVRDRRRLGDEAYCGFITWDPEADIEVRYTRMQENVDQAQQGTMSAKLALLHEMAHAHQALSQESAFHIYKDSYSDARKEKDKEKKMDLLEQPIVEAIEHTVANELNRLTGGKAGEGKRMSYLDTAPTGGLLRDNNTYKIRDEFYGIGPEASKACRI